MMANALDYARYLIQLAGTEPEAGHRVPLTPLQLQKVLYYVQGWALAMTGQAAFADRIKAWKHGPVVPVVWQAFKDCRSRGIERERGDDSGLTKSQRALALAVWERYRRYSAGELWRMTHSEPPYQFARGDRARDENASVEIPLSAMAEYFNDLRDRLIDGEVPPQLRPERIEQASRDLAAGKGRDLEEVMAELGHAI